MFPKCRGKGVYNVLTFQKSRGARAHLGGANAPLNETLVVFTFTPKKIKERRALLRYYLDFLFVDFHKSALFKSYYRRPLFKCVV